MLALYNRRMGPSTFDGYAGLSRRTAPNSEKISRTRLHLLQDYFGEVVVCPELSRTIGLTRMLGTLCVLRTTEY